MSSSYSPPSRSSIDESSGVLQMTISGQARSGSRAGNRNERHRLRKKERFERPLLLR